MSAKRASEYVQVLPGATAHEPCDHCGGKMAMWTEQPRQEHNMATLYECLSCRAVMSLCDFLGDDPGWLP